MRPMLSALGTETREQELLEALAEAEGRLRLCERQLIESNHRIANTLQIVSGLIEAKSIRVADPVAKEVLDTAAARVRAVALLHSHLCRHNRTARVDLGRLLAEMAPVIVGATGVRCEVDTEPTEVPGQTALHLAIAVNELVLNARKHAYGGRDGGAVRVACRRAQDGCLNLSVADCGGGLPAGFDPRRTEGLGVAIVRATAQQLGGELRAENDGGACFTLLLPLSYVADG